LKDFRLRSLDLNLLRIFSVLLDERSVTRTAKRLNVVPSAISHALARLREAIGDDLFVRGVNGMQPTSRAVDIGPRVQWCLLQLDKALQPTQFEPSECSRQFTIYTSPYPSWVVLPSLMRRFGEEAPNAEARIRRRAETLVDDLSFGRIDVAVGRFDTMPDGIVTEPFFDDSWVWIMRGGHPHGDRPLTLEALAALSLVVVSSRERGTLEVMPFETTIEHRLKMRDGEPPFPEEIAHDLRRGIRLDVADSMSAFAAVTSSDMTALVPKRLVDAVGNLFGVRVFEAPYQVETLDFHLAWNANIGSDAGAAWFRDLVRSSARRIV
jgi:DNA-binding transcriptional LysR family regulator